MSLPVHKSIAPCASEVALLLERARMGTVAADEEDTQPSEIVFGGDDEDTQDVADGGA